MTFVGIAVSLTAPRGGVVAASLAAEFTITDSGSTAVSSRDDGSFLHWDLDTAGETYTLTVTKSGYIQQLAFGGGGAGGTGNDNAYGGGGGAEYVRSIFTWLDAGDTHTLTVGEGGKARIAGGAAHVPSTNTTTVDGAVVRAGGNGRDQNNSTTPQIFTGKATSGGWSSQFGTFPFSQPSTLLFKGSISSETFHGGAGAGASAFADGGTTSNDNGADGAPGMTTNWRDTSASDEEFGFGGGGGSVKGTRGAGSTSAGAGASRPNSQAAQDGSPGSGGGGGAWVFGSNALQQGGNGGDGFIALRQPKNDAFGAVVSEPPYEGAIVGVDPATNTFTYNVDGTVIAPDGLGVEARIINADTGAELVTWTTMSRVGNLFTGTLSGAETLPRCKIESRVVGNADSTYTQATSWKPGLVVDGFGQSNWQFMNSKFTGNGGQTNTIEDESFIYTAEAATGGTLAEFLTVNTATGMAAFMSELTDITGLSVLVISSGRGATPIHDFDNSGADTDIWDGREAAFNYLKPQFISAQVGHQGESNVDNQESTWFSNLNTVFGLGAAKTAQTASAIPKVWSSIGRERPDETGGSSRIEWQNFRELQIGDFASEVSNGVIVDEQADLLVDDFHYDAKSYQGRGKRLARVLAEQMGYATAPTNEFSITGAVRTSATTIRVTVQHGRGTDFEFVVIAEAVDTGVEGTWTATTVAADASEYVKVFTSAARTTELAVSGVQRINATTFDITHATHTTGVSLYFDTLPESYPNAFAWDNSTYKFALRQVWAYEATAS